MDYAALFRQIFVSLFLQWAMSRFAPRPKRTGRPNSLSDFAFATSSETRPIPALFGTVRVEGPNTLWAGDFATNEVKKKVKTGLFTKDTVVVGDNYFLGFAMALGHASAGNRLTKIWVDDRLAWSGSIASGGTANVNVAYGDGDLKSGLKGTFEFHCGDLTPSAYLERRLGAGNVPAYPHLAYVVFRGPDGADPANVFGGTNTSGWVGTAGSLPKIHYEVQNIDVVPSEWVPPADAAAYAVRKDVSGDSNPAYVLYRVLLDDLYGAGLTTDLVDWDSFHEAAGVLHAEGNGWSMEWSSARSVEEFSQQVEQQINGAVVPHPTTGKLSLRLIRETEDVALVLSPSTIVNNGLRSFSRVSAEDAANEITVAFKDRTNSYVERTAFSQDLGGVLQAGQVNNLSVEFPGATRPELVSALATREVRAAAAPLARIAAVAMTDSMALRPGDVAQFNWPPLGISNLRMRLLSVRYRDSVSGEVEVEAVEDAFLGGMAVYSTGLPPVTGGSGTGTTTPPTSAAGRSRLIQAPYALAQTEYDRAMLLVAPADSSQVSFDVAYSDNNSTTFNPAQAAWDPNGNLPLMAAGNLAANLSETAATVSMSMSAVNGALLKAMTVPAGGLLVLVGDAVYNTADGRQPYEWMRCSAFSVAADNLSATLTISRRAIFDSHPERAVAGKEVWVIPKAVLDPGGLATCRTTEVLNGPVLGEVVPGEPFARPFVFFRSAAGVLATAGTLVGSLFDGIAQDGTGGNYQSRCSRPTNAGECKVNGITGAYSHLDGSLPTIPASGTLTLTWKNRNKKHQTDPETPWASGTGTLLPTDIATRWMLQKLRPGGAMSSGTQWDNVASGLVINGAETATTSASGLSSGDTVRLFVHHYGSAAGVEVWPADMRALYSHNVLARHYTVA